LSNPQHLTIARLDAADAVYFSTVTAATVGFGDVYPVTHVAQAIVMIQILTTAAAITLFVAYLLRQREPAPAPGDATK
jgi:hypothetical protein